LDFYLRCRFPWLSNWDRVLTPRGRQQQLLRQVKTAVVMGTLIFTLFFYRWMWNYAVDNGSVDRVANIAISLLEFVAKTVQQSRGWVL
jgi:hypothetical protein